MFDLEKWYDGLHKITGAMSTRFGKATSQDLQNWSQALSRIASQMDEAAESTTDEAVGEGEFGS